MKTMQLLNSIQKEEKYLSLVTLETVMLPPFIRDNKIYSLATTIKSLKDNLHVNRPFLLFSWDLATKEFIEAKRVLLDEIQFDFPYKTYTLKYIELCSKIDQTHSNHLSEFFPKLEEIYKNL
jgi:hypothetical protein